MDDATNAVLAAVRVALLADPDILASLASPASVYDRPPQECPVPFVVIGEASFQDWSTADGEGQDIRLDVHVWDESASQTPDIARCKALMRRIRDVLHFRSLALAAPFHAVLCQVTARVGPLIDPDGISIHGVLTVNVLTDHI